jgi:hypothetical protein
MRVQHSSVGSLSDCYKAVPGSQPSRHPDRDHALNAVYERVYCIMWQCMKKIMINTYIKNVWNYATEFKINIFKCTFLVWWPRRCFYIHIFSYITCSETNTIPISNFVFDYIILRVKVCSVYSLWYELRKIELKQRKWFIVKLGSGCICRNMFCHG